MENKTAQFRVILNGPLEVSGDFILTGIDGKPIEVKSPVYLCRCGDSQNKPFCDGTHKKNGFHK